ncbi:MAG: hypothetical protein ACKON8_09290, partial [Planctomycetota bacterium]
TARQPEILARHEWVLSLTGLEQLGGRQAESLARHKGRVVLGTPETFTPEERAILRASRGVTFIPTRPGE